MTSNIPSNLTAPIFTFDVTSGGAFENENRLIILAHGLAAGSLAEGAIAICNTKTDARNLAGAGSMLEAMFLVSRANAPSQEIWLGRVADTGTAEQRTITVGAVPAAGGQGVVQIAGKTVSLQINAGDTANAVAAALAAAINSYYDSLTGMSLPFTATVATNVVTITARHKGAYASGLDIYIPTLDTVNAFDGVLTFATSVAGAGVPDLSDVLAAMNDDPFEMIVSAFGDTANLTLLDTFLNTVSGRWSYAQQLYGHAFYPATDTSSNLVTKALAKDSWHLTMIPRFSAGGFAEPDYLWVAGFVARIAPWAGGGSNGDVSRNQSGLVVQNLSAPRDRNYWMDYATRDALLKNSVSTWKIDRSGNVLIDKIITQQQTTNGAPDTTFRDVQKIYQLTYALKKFRADLAAEHSNKAIADSNPSNLASISTVADIKATLFHSYQQMAGVLENSETALANLVVTRDSDNANRVNVSLPLDFVNPLDILAGLATAYSQFANAA
ncbi:phage tail sheath subtilisin-like domain-containing protein [Rhizobium sp. BK602]|uniref:phage tail sheath subtilisin-like domain-containing protein n=1 Tax=Rhizobium sp. BK602 TaxID=2586986 RepID=UPI0016137B26|nr:phage tail sheath subtilisin-like domain-containing protein [Rhizobium sp. BK602]MBB3608668.1 phage tail sheath gpL-like [Rhizobium sp. BK602]